MFKELDKLQELDISKELRMMPVIPSTNLIKSSKDKKSKAENRNDDEPQFGKKLTTNL